MSQPNNRPSDGGRKPGRRNNPIPEDDEWIPRTKLGRLVKAGKFQCIDEVFLFSQRIQEYQIIDHFYPEGTLFDEVMKIMPVQKQTTAGQRTRFKAFVVIGDKAGHVGLGVKSAKEVAVAIRGALIAAKLSLIPVRRGYWGNKIGAVHSLPMNVTGKCGSVMVRLIPAPRGTNIIGAPVPKKMLEFAGVQDCFTCSSGHTRTRGNFLKATYNALSQTYRYLTPDLWKEIDPPDHPLFLFSDLFEKHDRRSVKVI